MSLRGYTLSVARRSHPRALPLLLAAPMLPPRALPRRPIFVIGSPRSGTSITMRLLTLAPGVASLETEGHVLWESFHHPRERHWESDALDAFHVGGVERRYLAWAIRLLAGPGRFADKTPRNVLRLPYLEALFPDASYVFVIRDGRAVVSSLLEAWPRGRRPPYLMPRGVAVQGMPERWWRFVLPPGWRDVAGASLEEICAHQYVASLEAMLAFRDRLDPERYTDLRYEELQADPVPVTERTLAAVGLEASPRVVEAARTRVRPPRSPERWETDHRRQIERVLPSIGPMLERTGYG